MDLQRNLFFLAFLFITLIIWQTWQIDHENYFSNKNKNQEHKINNSLTQNFKEITNKCHLCNIITIKTDVLLLKVNTYGGNIEEAFLLSYSDKLNSKKPFHLLENSKDFIYQAQIGLISKDYSDSYNDDNVPIYYTKYKSYIMKDNQNKLIVSLIYTSMDRSVTFTKNFILKRGDFDVKITYNINNNNNKSIELVLFGKIKQSINLNEERKYNNNFTLHSYRGVAYSTSDNKYKKYSFKNIKNKDLFVITKGGWIAMLQQYFATAWIPCLEKESIFYTKFLNNKQENVEAGFKSYPFFIGPYSNLELSSILWIGPEIQDKMAKIAPYLDLTVDYGLFWFISQPLFKLLKFIYIYIGNWGFSIILITFIVRGIMYPLTKAQYVSMAKMRMLQPKIISIRERFINNKQRQNQEIINLYKEEKINPLGGCLSVLIQMPIFLALYYMLSCSIELRHAPFILWIKDLSSQDPYYILPILMGITMFVIQKLSPSNINDSTQRKIISFMPFIFTLFFLWFPSGLVLYYIVSNLVTVIQQQIIYKSLNKIYKN